MIEEPAELEVEITLAEQDAARVRPDQAVVLRVRASPFETKQGVVSRGRPHGGSRRPAKHSYRLCPLPGERPGAQAGNDKPRPRLHRSTPDHDDPGGPSAALATHRVLVVVVLP